MNKNLVIQLLQSESDTIQIHCQNHKFFMVVKPEQYK